uniref:exodeoxyribonuclease III n=1 Tax=Naja naja TaxID=35670 RepID=A0A8C7E2H6_NAJNA
MEKAQEFYERLIGPEEQSSKDELETNSQEDRDLQKSRDESLGNRGNTQPQQEREEEERKILSINKNGLNSMTKRRKILAKLIKQNADIVCLQETRIKKSDEKYLECPKLGKLYTAPADSGKKKGIVVYVKDDIKVDLIILDPDGRTLILQIWINSISIILVVIYAPNGDQKEFFKHLYEKIVGLEKRNICILGDFNAIVDYQKDHSGGRNTKKKRQLPKICMEMMMELNLIDIWRRLNPDKKQFTFYSNPHQIWTRIEMIWMNGEVANELKGTEILPNEWADHNPIQILWKGSKKPKKRWTLNTQLIREKAYTNRN